MRPRLVGIEVVRDARMLPAEQVQPGDWRLVHLNEAACRKMVADQTVDSPLIYSFVAWPDLSLRFVALPAEGVLPLEIVASLPVSHHGQGVPEAGVGLKCSAASGAFF